ncbi:hypothetical protein B0O99DRAFT_726142, partial [Bisporella sp. PMI_857]
DTENVAPSADYLDNPFTCSPDISTSIRTLPNSTNIFSFFNPHLPSPDPTERTSFKLAKQLRKFQGCTHEQHREADRSHHEHHQQPDVHSECSSVQQITAILRGHTSEHLVPDVLSSPKLMKPADINGLNLRTAFEGSHAPSATSDIPACDDHLPKNLCLSQCHTTTRKTALPRHPSTLTVHAVSRPAWPLLVLGSIGLLNLTHI